MTTLLDTELVDFKITLDDTEILNDLRVMIPNYSYDLVWVEDGGVFHVETVNYHDLVHTSIDSTSIDKYGRRSKVNKYQVMGASFEEAWCEAQKQKYAEPYYSLQATLSPEQIVKMLTTKLSDVLTVTETISGVNNEYLVTSWVLEARPVRTFCTIGLKEQDTDQQLNLFYIDTDEIDGDHILGW